MRSGSSPFWQIANPVPPWSSPADLRSLFLPPHLICSSGLSDLPGPILPSPSVLPPFDGSGSSSPVISRCYPFSYAGLLLHLIECVYRDFKTSRRGPAFSYHLGLGSRSFHETVREGLAAHLAAEACFAYTRLSGFCPGRARLAISMVSVLPSSDVLSRFRVVASVPRRCSINTS